MKATDELAVARLTEIAHRDEAQSVTVSAADLRAILSALNTRQAVTGLLDERTVERVARIIDPLTWRDRDAYVMLMSQNGGCAPETINEIANRRVRESIGTAKAILEALTSPVDGDAPQGVGVAGKTTPLLPIDFQHKGARRAHH